ncbi:MAG: CRTAC1 family protein [Planctomycetota bacterium]|nr:CRTAC1 family protein [Planctomycetota bacterium]
MLSARSLALSLLVAAPAVAQGPHFVDQSVARGVEFRHFDGAFAYAMGGGCGWLDIENDGDEDLFAAGSDSRHALFQNDGTGNFTDVIVPSGIAVSQFGSTIGVAVADYSGDGFADLFISTTGANQLYRNQGNGTFVDEALAVGMIEYGWSTSASWADFDLDGDLDLYVGNYVKGLSFPYHYGEANYLYINQGTPGAPNFVNEAVTLGVDDSGVFGPTVPGYPYIAPTGAVTAGCTLSVCTLDEDEDGDPDLMIGNDFGQWVLPNRFFRNDVDQGGGLVFTDISAATQFDQWGHYNMGILPADYDHDGDWDLYMSNLGDNLLLRRDGSLYNEVAAAAGVLEGLNEAGDKLLSSWGTSFGDLDNDGWEDLLVVNGLIPAALFITNEERAPNHILMNDQGAGTFTRVDPVQSGMADEGAGRGLAVVDLDSDGFLDYYLMNNGATGASIPSDRCRFFRNQGTLATPGASNWLELDLVGRFGNTEGLGSNLTATGGGTTWKRQVLGDPVFLSASSRMVHFGLGTVGQVDVVIDWPLGGHQELVGVPAGFRFEVIEPVVRVNSIDAPVWTGTDYLLRAHLENADTNASKLTDLSFNLHLGQNGPLALSIPLQVNLAPGEQRQVDILLPADANLHAALQGLTLDQRVYVGADQALDSRRQVVPIP